jgi:hypothetical protein
VSSSQLLPLIHPLLLNRRAVIVKTPGKADAASADSGAFVIVPTEASVFDSR